MRNRTILRMMSIYIIILYIYRERKEKESERERDKETEKVEYGCKVAVISHHNRFLL